MNDQFMDARNWNSKHFSPRELQCKVTSKLKVRKELIEALDKMRDTLGRAVRITSGYRDPLHPIEAAKADGVVGKHTLGIAADVAIGTHNRHDLVSAAIDAGFTGIGINIKRGYIHLDVRPQDQRTVYVY